MSGLGAPSGGGTCSALWVFYFPDALSAVPRNTRAMQPGWKPLGQEPNPTSPPVLSTLVSEAAEQSQGKGRWKLFNAGAPTLAPTFQGRLEKTLVCTAVHPQGPGQEQRIPFIALWHQSLECLWTPPPQPQPQPQDVSRHAGLTALWGRQQGSQTACAVREGHCTFNQSILLFHDLSKMTFSRISVYGRSYWSTGYG